VVGVAIIIVVVHGDDGSLGRRGILREMIVVCGGARGQKKNAAFQEERRILFLHLVRL